MFSISLKTLRANLPRLLTTLVAIAVGVAFLVAGNMLTLSIRNSLGGEIDRQYAEVDAAVRLQNVDLANNGLAITGVPEDLVEEIAALPGVEAAVGERNGLTRFADQRMDDLSFTSGFGMTVRAWYDSDLNVATLVDGRAPTAPGEVTIDRGTAKERDLSVGDVVELTSIDGVVEAEVVGITSFGTTNSADQGGTVTADPSWAFDLGANASRRFQSVLVQGDGSVTDGELAEAVRDLLPEGFTAVTGDTYRAELREDFEAILDVLSPVLTGFALLALFVCGFVIFNTFSVVVQQRTRELALMRAVAATPRQVRRSVRLEGFGIGVIGSLAGIALGSLLAWALGRVLEALDLGLPPARFVLTWWMVVLGLAAGVLVTMVAVLLPAWRAGRTAPVAAMREAAIERVRLGRARLALAIVFLVVGVVLCLLESGWAVGTGAFLFAMGVFLAGPALTVVMARATRPLLARTGVAGRLSSDNVARNPRRTATTMNALVIGVLLVTLVSIAGNSLKSTVVNYIGEHTSVDLYLGAFPGTLPSDVVERVENVDGVDTMVRVKQITVTVDGQIANLSTSDDLEALSDLNIRPEDMEWSELGDDAVALATDPNTATLGRKVATNELGETLEFDHVGLLEDTFDAGSLGYVVSPETFEKIAPPDVDVNMVLIALTPGKKGDATNEIEDITLGYGNVFAIKGNFIARMIEAVFDFLINMINGLLGMSVVIALIGIVNTLTLSIFERRRELGLLRAVGMTRREVRRMVRFEAVQMSVLGTVIGLASGALLAWLLLRATELESVRFNAMQLVVVFLLGLLIGILASLLPTRRVSRLDILEAIKTE